MSDIKDLADRVILITGASRGIGYFAALEAAKRGAHIIAVARTIGGLEELDDEIQDAGGTATLVPLDITEGDKIDQMGGSIFERWGQARWPDCQRRFARHYQPSAAYCAQGSWQCF